MTMSLWVKRDSHHHKNVLESVQKAQQKRTSEPVLNYTPKTTREELQDMLKSTTGHLIENIRPDSSIPEFNVPIQKGVQTLT